MQEDDKPDNVIQFPVPEGAQRPEPPPLFTVLPGAAAEWAGAQLDLLLKTDLADGWGEAIGMVQAHACGHLTDAQLGEGATRLAELLNPGKTASAYARTCLALAGCPLPEAEIEKYARAALAEALLDAVRNRPGLPDCSERVLRRLAELKKSQS